MAGGDLIVIDASAVVALVATRDRVGDHVARRLTGAALHAPHSMPVEVDSALRGLAAGGRLSAPQADAARRQARDLPIDLWPWHLLSDRAWELRHNLTTYDAGYVALAEEIGGTVLTADARMAQAPGLRCAVEIARAP